MVKQKEFFLCELCVVCGYLFLKLSAFIGGLIIVFLGGLGALGGSGAFVVILLLSASRRFNNCFVLYCFPLRPPRPPR